MTSRSSANGLLLVMLMGTGFGIAAMFMHHMFDPSVKCRAADVVIGMTEQQLVSVCGLPERRNYSSNGPTQWVYWGPETLFVYTDEGRVASKQWND